MLFFRRSVIGCMLGVNDMIADGSYMFGQDIQTATGKISIEAF
jgi:hypothetical protein